MSNPHPPTRPRFASEAVELEHLRKLCGKYKMEISWTTLSKGIRSVRAFYNFNKPHYADTHTWREAA